MPAKTKDQIAAELRALEQDGSGAHDALVEQAATALRDAGRFPEHNVLAILPDALLSEIIAYWQGE